MLLVCPNCLTRNRVVAERLGDTPVCGHCKTPLLDGRPLELSDAHFDRLSQDGDLPLVVDFWAAWCNPCKMMAPSFASAARQLQGQAVFGKLDTEAWPTLAGRLRIQSIPTLVVLQHGREIARRSGAMAAADLVSWLRSVLARTSRTH